MFKSFLNLFSSKKKSTKTRLPPTNRNYEPGMFFNYQPTKPELRLVEEDTTLEDIVETAILVEATCSLFDSVMDCNDIQQEPSTSTDTSDWSGNGGGFSGAGSSEDF